MIIVRADDASNVDFRQRSVASTLHRQWRRDAQGRTGRASLRAAIGKAYIRDPRNGIVAAAAGPTVPTAEAPGSCAMLNVRSGARDRNRSAASIRALASSAAAKAADAIRSGAYQLGLQGAGLLVVALVLALGGWIGHVQANRILLATLSVAFLVLSGVAFVLFREHRSWRATERALRSVQARAHDLFESAADAIILVDECQRILMFNAAAEAAFYWPRAAVVGQPLAMLIPERLRDTHRAYVAEFARSGAGDQPIGALRSLTGLRANGEEFPLEASISQHVEDGRRLLTVILRDITERVRSEALLARSEARLRSILGSAMDAVITIDDRQNVVLFNAAAEAMFDCPREEAIGMRLETFIPERYREVHARHVEAFGKAGITSRRMGGTRVVTGLRRGGEEFPIDASISQLVEGDRRFYTVILRDVGELTRAMEALARSKDELRELATAAISAREQEQRRIARELHDELAQSMSTLKMDIALIRARGCDDAALRQRLDGMDRQIDGTIGVMRRIAADLRPLALDDLGLAAALQSLVHGFQGTSGVSCVLSLADPLDLPSGHATAVFRIVQEALTNVRKHAKASTVTVSVAVDGDCVEVVVRDDGVGFADDAPRKPRSFGHLGIRERAYLLGGDARITSAAGQGTQVAISLPVEPVPRAST
jgi:PAS domain S-box-containing protein